MELFDTHCHIQSSEKSKAAFGERVTISLWGKAGHPSGDRIIEHAAEGGINRMVCVGCDIGDSAMAVRFVQDRPQCWASIGIHPHEASRYVQDGAVQRDALAVFAMLATKEKVVAIGECGLDYFYEHSSPADQALILRYQIELAQKHNLPMIFHVREALDDFWPIFDEYHTSEHPIRGVLHSFTDSMTNLDKAMERGLYIGVNGIATFAKDPKQQAMYKAIPLSRLVLETDSPFLTPAPYRGTICEPYHISVTAEFLAQQRSEPLAELAAATTVNARNLFKL